MKKTNLKYIAVAFLAAIGVSSFAFGQPLIGSVTQTQDFSFIPRANETFTFNQFNAGSIVNAKNVVLTGITVTFTLQKTNGSLQGDNESAVGGSVTLIQTVDATLSAPNQSVYMPSIALSATSSYSSSIGPTSGDSTTAFDRTLAGDYIDSGLFNPVSTGSSASINSALWGGVPTVYASYEGTGTYTLALASTQGTSTDGLSGVSLASSPANASGTVQVVYNYTYEDIPEPSTWAMILGGVGTLGLVQRFRRRNS